MTFPAFIVLFAFQYKAVPFEASIAASKRSYQGPHHINLALWHLAAELLPEYQQRKPSRSPSPNRIQPFVQLQPKCEFGSDRNAISWTQKCGFWKCSETPLTHCVIIARERRKPASGKRVRRSEAPEANVSHSSDSAQRIPRHPSARLRVSRRPETGRAAASILGVSAKHRAGTRPPPRAASPGLTSALCVVFRKCTVFAF
ncbi:hypothetical protein B0H15DRAFT_446671 [Mycena belliarum]|uniref:Uncharacterized protein n=1 Tax=Mycena belliarum TaxID=1033014 RepID=A0AAD6TZI2_9AGAR|nr:hypothetical protein B0H15DRAFT_446671 [Mycena belliae]